MQLLTGPAGSGKTFSALASLREALRRGDASVRLLVPTTTMAQHLRDELAREGLVFSPTAIQTISRFIEPWTSDVPEVSPAVFTMLVEQAVLRLGLPEFQAVAGFAGLHARLAAAIEECATAGADARDLRERLPEGLGRAVARVFEQVEKMLAERRAGLRATRLRLAAGRIAENGIQELRCLWLDGFFSFSDPELALVRALAKRAEVTVTMPADDISAATKARLLSAGFTERKLARRRPRPVTKLVAAPGIEREVDEIARRILDDVEQGRHFRDIGIIVRSPEVYARLLQGTLERFGIPARFYFDLALTEQPAIRFLAGAVDAMLAGWPFEQTLAVMKLAPGAGHSPPMDRLDFEIRKRMPGSGLEPLREMAKNVEGQDRRHEKILTGFSEIERLRNLRIKPADWLEELVRLCGLYRPPRPQDGISHQTVMEWRSQAQALLAFESVVAEAASLFDERAKISLEEFWPAVEAMLRLTPLRLRDERRNVVHVLSAYEARQWDLPVVFVCGLVEGQFPRYQPPDVFLPEPVRRRLRESGLPIRTAEDFAREERFLFDSAMARATEAVVMSYPKNDARGELNLPSLFLENPLAAMESRNVRVRTARAGLATVPGSIHAPALLALLRERHREMKPTALEAYLQCAFQFFGRHTLKLESAPPRPEERLDFRLRGTIVHQVIKEWLEAGGEIEPIFQRVFGEVTEKESVVAGYQTELVRAQVFDDLRRFAASEQWAHGWRSQAEIAARFEISDGVIIRCRLDRLIQGEDGRAFIVDYKYSPNARNYTNNEDLLQGPLYWLAAERGFGLNVAGVFYCSLREAVKYAGWGEKPDWMKAAVQPPPPEWLASAMKRSAAAAFSITTGRVTPEPSDVSKCRYCDFRDACRYSGAAAAIAESGE